jgi:hypothetical protein
MEGSGGNANSSDSIEDDNNNNSDDANIKKISTLNETVKKLKRMVTLYKKEVNRLKELASENDEISMRNKTIIHDSKEKIKSLSDVQKKYNDINTELNEVKGSNSNLIEQNAKFAKDNETLKKKLKQALLKLKSVKTELEENRYELISTKSKFVEYREQSSKSLRIANNKIDNIVIQEGSFDNLRKELEDARTKCDNAIVDLKFANEEKDNLRKELNEKIKQTKLLQMKKEDTVTKIKNKELKTKVNKLKDEIKRLSMEHTNKDKKHHQELLKKTENARKAIFEQEKDTLELKKQCLAFKNNLEKELKKNEELNATLKKIQMEYDKQQDENQKEADEIDMIMNLAKKQASRDSNMESMKNKIIALENEVKELKEINNALKDELVLLTSKEKQREMEENIRLEDYQLRIKREKDLMMLSDAEHNIDNAGDEFIQGNATTNCNAPKHDTETSKEPNEKGNHIKKKVQTEANSKKKQLPPSTKPLSKQATTVEYLKNCLVQFLCSETAEEQRQLLPVLSTILHFNKKERSDALKALELRNQGVTGSLISLVSTFSGVNNGGTSKNNYNVGLPATW